MRHIGIISDTHGLLRPEALEALAGSDLILHAGDVGDAEVLERLGRIAPVVVVRGNTDWGPLGATLPATTVADLGARDGRVTEDPPLGPLAYMLHDLEDLDLDPASAGIAVVVTGHTHRAVAERRGGVLHLNPGSAGPRRGDLPVTVARLEVGAHEGPATGSWAIDVEIVTLL